MSSTTSRRHLSYDLCHTLFEIKEDVLYWRVDQEPVKTKGKPAGTVIPNGRMMTHIHQTKYYNHRIIFLMHKGYLPEYIDHADNNPLNNSIDNLRECTLSQNAFNRSMNTNNTSGVKGVSWDKSNRSWLGRVAYKNKTYKAGNYRSLEDAERGVRLLREELHREFTNHGETR